MPGIDYDRLREEITMEEVLRLIAFEPTKQYGDQWYGRCPWHETRSRRGRTFSVNVVKGLFYCHECRRKGNQLQLWAEHTGLLLHPAMIDLCDRLGREVPWLGPIDDSGYTRYA